MRQKEKEREREKEPLGVGFLEDQDYYCYYHCLISPPLLPPPIFLISSASPSFLSITIFLLVSSSLQPFLSSTSYTSLHLSFFLCPFLSFLAFSVRTGCQPTGASEERESKREPNEMSIASVQTGPILSAKNHHHHHTTLLCTRHRILSVCLPGAAAAAPAQGIAKGKVCVCGQRVTEGCI